MGAWGRRGRGSSPSVPPRGPRHLLPSRRDQPSPYDWALARNTAPPTPRALKVKAWATSTGESSQAGCLECEHCSRQAGGTWGSASGSQEAREGRKSLSEHFSSTCLSCTCQRFVETPRVSRRPQECRLLLPPRILEAALGGQGSCLRSWNWKAGPRSGQPGSARRRVTSGHRSPLSTEPTFGVGQAIDSQS